MAYVERQRHERTFRQFGEVSLLIVSQFPFVFRHTSVDSTSSVLDDDHLRS